MRDRGEGGVLWDCCHSEYHIKQERAGEATERACRAAQWGYGPMCADDLVVFVGRVRGGHIC